jgi:Ras-related protein Rab-8A
MGIVLVYDVADEKSFANIQNWSKNVEQHASEGVCKILVGNKCDIEERRVISPEQGKALAAQLGMQFMETSAKSGYNVEHLFSMLALQVKAKIEEAAAISSAKATSALNLSKAVNGKAGGTSVENKGNSTFKCCSIV